MLRLPDRVLSKTAETTLGSLQDKVSEGADFAARSRLATQWWDKKAGTKARKAVFSEIRATLAEMSYGSVRCAYCEDSAADEIEHIAPKTVFPSRAFLWRNYCFSCGPCNGPKGNRFAVISTAGVREELNLKTLGEEPILQYALIDPRSENPTDYLELDIGGLGYGGMVLPVTALFLPREGLSPSDEARANWTIEVLNLNREVVRKSREIALGSYISSLADYSHEKAAGTDNATLEAIRDNILMMPHPTVLSEVILKANTQPKVLAAMTAAPEIATWIRR